MTEQEFREMMECNEPDLEIRGKYYSITCSCAPDYKYYAMEIGASEDDFLEFESLDDLLEHWVIQGTPLRELLDEIE